MIIQNFQVLPSISEVLISNIKDNNIPKGMHIAFYHKRRRYTLMDVSRPYPHKDDKIPKGMYIFLHNKWRWYSLMDVSRPCQHKDEGKQIC